jgi:hypothetical protein
MLCAVVGREVEIISERLAEIEVDHGRRIKCSRLHHGDIVVLYDISVDIDKSVIEGNRFAVLVVMNHDPSVIYGVLTAVFHSLILQKPFPGTVRKVYLF